MMGELKHRDIVSYILRGQGLEIGAFNAPYRVPAGVLVKYLDVDTAENIAARFNELDGPGETKGIIRPDYICDAGKTPVIEATQRKFDFIIANHILEHVANPIRFLENVWGALEEGGLLLLSVPDKDYTFDKPRELTTFEHLVKDYEDSATVVDDAHYEEMWRDVHPGIEFTETLLKKCHERHEHVHVWDSSNAKKHILKIMQLLKNKASLVFESSGDENKWEYFCILRKGPKKTKKGYVAEYILEYVYRSRKDLQSSFTNMKDLFVWAASHGSNEDSARDILSGYRDYYAKAARKAKAGTIEAHFKAAY